MDTAIYKTNSSVTNILTKNFTGIPFTETNSVIRFTGNSEIGNGTTNIVIGSNNIAVGYYSTLGSTCDIYPKNFKNYKSDKLLYPGKYYAPNDMFDIKLHGIGTDIFQNILRKCNSNNMAHNKFKQICMSLENNDMHNKIKEFIIDNDKNNDPIQKQYFTLLTYIFENNLTDITIKFPNNEYYECNKLVLKTNEYFKKMLDDCELINNEMHLITDPELTLIIIKLLHNNYNQDINISKFHKLFLLTDMMLIDEPIIGLMLDTLKSNLNVIIYYEMEQNNFNNINNFIEQLKNIFQMVDNYYEETRREAYNIYTSILNLEFGDKIFNFVNWNMLFSDEQKLNAIKLTNNFELVNDANIPFKTGIDFLKELDFANDIYTEIENIVSCSGTNIYFKENNIDVKYYETNYGYNYQVIKSVIVLEEWFPIFKINIFERVIADIIESNQEYITIAIRDANSKQICVNSKILIGHILSSNSENIFTVENIIKCLNDKTANVNSTIYTSNSSIKYKIKLNKCVPDIYNELVVNEKVIQYNPNRYSIFIMKQINHKVKYTQN
jgi:hypothetical protein